MRSKICGHLSLRRKAEGRRQAPCDSSKTTQLACTQSECRTLLIPMPWERTKAGHILKCIVQQARSVVTGSFKHTADTVQAHTLLRAREQSSAHMKISSHHLAKSADEVIHLLVQWLGSYTYSKEKWHDTNKQSWPGANDFKRKKNSISVNNSLEQM